MLKNSQKPISFSDRCNEKRIFLIAHLFLEPLINVHGGNKVFLEGFGTDASIWFRGYKLVLGAFSAMWLRMNFQQY